MEQQYPDGFPSYLRHQLALDRLCGHQADRPPRLPLGRSTANHRDDPLSLAVVQQRNGPRSLLVPERPIQALLRIAPSNLTDCLRGQADVGGHLGNRFPLVQLRQGQGAEHNPHRLDSTTQEMVHLVPVPLGQAYVQSTIGSHDPCYTKAFSLDSVLE